MVADAAPSTETPVQPQQEGIREDLVSTAVKFLANPNIIKTSLAEQQKFLRRKGLSDEEIRTACERSGAYAYHEERNRPPPLPTSTSFVAPISQPAHFQITLFDRVRELVHNFAIFSIVAYAVYKFYEKFIAPFLFGRKKKSVEDSIEDLEKNVKESLNELQSSLSSVKVEVDKISHGAENNTQRQLSDLKSEIGTVKGLLLSRNQFPPVSKSSVVRPSIPDWQKSSLTHDSDAESDPERKAEDLSDHGSGGSSEPEHNTNKSDSSLDIISFSSKDSDFQRHKHLKDDSDKD